MAGEYKCEVVEDVVLVTEVVKLLDFAVLGASTVVATDFVLADGAPTLTATVLASETVVADAHAIVIDKVKAGSEMLLSLNCTVVEVVRAFDSVHYIAIDEVVEGVQATESLELHTLLLLAEGAKASETVQIGTSIASLVSDNVVGFGTARSFEGALLESYVAVGDAAEAITDLVLSTTARALGMVNPIIKAFTLIKNTSVARETVLTYEQASITENLVLSAEVEAVSSFLCKDSARASEHLALSTAITQQTTERVSASEYLVVGDANMAEDRLIIVDIQQPTVRAQGQLRSEAIAQEQPVGEVDRGYFVHDQLAASESLHAEISAPLEVLVLANDHIGLGFEAVAPEMVGGTHAFAEMTGQGSALVQCLEVLQATATAEFLVGTTNGVYEMLAAEYITVYDRVEFVEALDSFAWVLNSQSLAHSYYDGFVDFNSAVQLGKRAFMLSPSGLYELGGDSDDGKIIEAEVVTGQKDFGTIDRKRVEQFDLGYTAAGALQAVVSCEGFDPSEPQTLEAREMRTAHTSRIRVGKGMVGRYWKLELKNREGADFELFSIQTKVALSTRRMR